MPERELRMDNKYLSSMEMDAIGEILNISLGASATAVSNMLNARVDITTPVVSVKYKDEFTFDNINPAVGVEIGYEEGLSGTNVMLLKRNDIRIIVGMLMGMDIPEDEFQLDEMNISAICEVMNQMMGASATALSELLGRFIDITPPQSFEVEGEQGFKDKYFDETEPMVIVGFSIQISGKMNSEFKNLMSVELAKELVAGFFAESPMAFSLDLLDEGGSTTHADPKPAQAQTKQEEKKMGDEKMETQTPIAQGLHTEANSQVQSQTGSDVVGGAGSMQSQPEQSQSKPSNDSLASVSSTPLPVFDPQMFAQGAGCDQQLMSSISMMIDTMREQIRTQQQQMDQLMQLRQGGNKKIKVDQPTKNTLDRSGNQMASMLDVEENMELIKTVPLDISVEIGRTKKLVKDILELNKGSLVVLDKLAGEEVDVFANGQCIAKGDVVVVDDNFAIRITEILTEEITSIG